MSTAILPIAYVPTEVDSLDLLEIVQQAWSVYTGKITKQELVRVVVSVLSDTDYQSEIDCGLAGDQLVSILYLYPKVAGLVYRLSCDWGELSEPIIEEVEIEEQVQFDLATTASTQYPALEIIHAQWQDECCDAEGTIITAPKLTIAAGVLTSAAAVHATALVRYRCERHTVILNAPRREGAIDQQWASVVVAAYARGVAYKVIDMPPGIVTFAADPDAVCGGSWSGTVRESVIDTYPPEPTGADLITETDYCKQTIIAEYLQAPS